MDRDGVINHDPGDYTTCIEEFTILPGLVETLQDFTKRGYAIVVITNQGGIAKGLYSLEDFYEIDRYMRDTFLKANIDYLETYFCPHHESVSRCLCRKPQAGMVEKAIARHHVDRSRSLMIGDKMRDLEAAATAGITTGVLVGVNQDLRTVRFPMMRTA